MSFMSTDSLITQLRMEAMDTDSRSGGMHSYCKIAMKHSARCLRYHQAGDGPKCVHVARLIASYSEADPCA
jgi:hypothetical protein